MVGTNIRMDQREALENLVHAFDFREAIVVQAPIGQGDFEEWGGDVGLVGVLAHIGGEEGGHKHIL